MYLTPREQDMCPRSFLFLTNRRDMMMLLNKIHRNIAGVGTDAFC